MPRLTAQSSAFSRAQAQQPARYQSSGTPNISFSRPPQLNPILGKLEAEGFFRGHLPCYVTFNYYFIRTNDSSCMWGLSYKDPWLQRIGEWAVFLYWLICFVSGSLKFSYYEKATKYEKKSPNLWHCLVTSNKVWDIFQIFVPFSEYLDFTSSAILI